MKLKMDYVYQARGEQEPVGYGGFRIDGHHLDIRAAKEQIAEDLKYKYPGKVFEIIPTTITDVDDGPATWVAWALFVSTIFASGLVAAGICTVIMGLMR